MSSSLKLRSLQPALPRESATPREHVRPRKTSFSRIAELQQGFFTAKQALSIGYLRKTHTHMVGIGQWVRVDRGIYRLSRYPETERPDLMRWYLWSRDRNDRPQGVFSHRTALDLYELTDDMPRQLEMTVPPGFRKKPSAPLSPICYVGIVAEADIRLYRPYFLGFPDRRERPVAKIAGCEG